MPAFLSEGAFLASWCVCTASLPLGRTEQGTQEFLRELVTNLDNIAAENFHFVRQGTLVCNVRKAMKLV
jgi:hypothetical protein